MIEYLEWLASFDAFVEGAKKLLESNFITALFGFVMLTIWLRRGGMRQREMGRIRPALILGHFALAAGGLVVWIVYLINDSDALKWIAFAALVVVALLGWTMFFIWLKQRQTTAQPAMAPTGGSAAARS